MGQCNSVCKLTGAMIMISYYLIFPVSLAITSPRLFEESSGKNINNTVAAIVLLLLYSYLAPYIFTFGKTEKTIRMKNCLLTSIFFVFTILMSRTVNKTFFKTGNLVLAAIIPILLFYISIQAAKKQDKQYPPNSQETVLNKTLRSLAPFYSALITILFLISIYVKKSKILS